MESSKGSKAKLLERRRRGEEDPKAPSPRERRSLPKREKGEIGYFFTEKRSTHAYGACKSVEEVLFYAPTGFRSHTEVRDTLSLSLCVFVYKTGAIGESLRFTRLLESCVDWDLVRGERSGTSSQFLRPLATPGALSPRERKCFRERK